MPRSYQLFTAFTLAFMAALAGCDAQTVTCEGDDANCACTVDEDCVLSKYTAPVPSAADCYNLEFCCPIDLAPIAATAAEENEANWDDAGCVDTFDATGCPDCEPGDVAWVECRSGKCVKTYQVDDLYQDPY